jgi:MoxR-like ATPase
MSTLQKFKKVREELNTEIIGQQDLIEFMLITLLCDGHMLVEGTPGLAKTKAIKTLAEKIAADFQRIQFTPDLLPSDLTGADIFKYEKSEFAFSKGPIFSNFILADEINRAPAKVQSALLEAMAEKQVTVGNKTYKLPDLFLVMATQNPIEQEGTYNLPEAELDRFLMYVKIDFPDMKSERQILKLARKEHIEDIKHSNKKAKKDLNEEDVFKAREEITKVYISEELDEYIINLIFATRFPEKYRKDLKEKIYIGASPRATIALDIGSKAKAWLEGRDYVIPNDIHFVIKAILRHRILLSYEAEAEGISTDQVIDEILNTVPIP